MFAVFAMMLGYMCNIVSSSKMKVVRVRSRNEGPEIINGTPWASSGWLEAAASSLCTAFINASAQTRF